MLVSVAFDGDSIGARAGAALLADDVEAVRIVSRSIEAGEEVWKAFAVNVGGLPISGGGDEGMIQIPADKLAELPGIREKYSHTVGATCSVGVGMKISEAARALLIAKKRGKDQIVIWSPEMQAEIDEMAAHPKTEVDKIADAYLRKSNGLAPKDEHAGFTGHSTGSKLKGTQGDHDESKEAADELAQAQDEAPAGPEQTYAADDFENQLHDAAQQQGSKDDADAKAQDDHTDEVKQRLVQVLSAVRQQMPQIQQIQQTSPEVYASLIALTQGLVDLGREVMGPQSTQPPADEKPQEVQKSERYPRCTNCNHPLVSHAGEGHCGQAYCKKKHVEAIKAGGKACHYDCKCSTPTPQEEEPKLEKSVSQIQPGQRKIQGKGRLQFDYSHILPEQAKQQGMKLTVTHASAEPGLDAHLVSEIHHNGNQVGNVTAYLDKDTKEIEPHSELEPKYRGQGLGQAMYEATYAHAKNTLGYNKVSGASHSADAHKLHLRLAQKHGFDYNAEQDPDQFMHKWGYPYQPYQYTIKDEMDPTINDDNIIGKGHGVSFHKDLTKAALGAQGGAEAGRSHLNLPAGSVKDGKVKITKPDTGGASWKQINSGMIQSQHPDAPLLGANSYPVSSRAPGS